MANDYLIFSLLVVFVLTMGTLWLKRRGMEYDYLLLLTAVITGFLVTEYLQVPNWYYRLPLMGVTVSVAMLLLAAILFMFGTQSRRIK